MSSKSKRINFDRMGREKRKQEAREQDQGIEITVPCLCGTCDNRKDGVHCMALPPQIVLMALLPPPPQQLVSPGSIAPMLPKLGTAYPKVGDLQPGCVAFWKPRQDIVDALAHGETPDVIKAFRELQEERRRKAQEMAEAQAAREKADAERKALAEEGAKAEEEEADGLPVSGSSPEAAEAKETAVAES